LGRHGLGRALVVQALQKSQGSVATAGAEDCAYGRVCESAIQLRQPAVIVACQVAVAPENSRVVLNAVAIGNDGESCVE
jgi:hypothetical protein